AFAWEPREATEDRLADLVRVWMFKCPPLCICLSVIIFVDSSTPDRFETVAAINFLSAGYVSRMYLHDWYFLRQTVAICGAEKSKMESSLIQGVIEWGKNS